jgi:hypothetical protein
MATSCRTRRGEDLGGAQYTADIGTDMNAVFRADINS